MHFVFAKKPIASKKVAIGLFLNAIGLISIAIGLFLVAIASKKVAIGFLDLSFYLLHTKN